MGEDVAIRKELDDIRKKIKTSKDKDLKTFGGMFDKGILYDDKEKIEEKV